MRQFNTRPLGNSPAFRKSQTQKFFAKRLKLDATPQEIMLHGALLSAFQPYRVTVCFQEPIGPYVADFFLYPLNVVIEVDGKIHEWERAAAKDKRRDTYMRNRGIRIMRFTNKEVAQDATWTAEKILAECGKLPLSGDPVAVTKCPPGSAIHGKSRAKKSARITRAP